MLEAIDSSFTIPTDVVKADITINLNEWAEKLGGDIVYYIGAVALIGAIGKFVLVPLIKHFTSRMGPDL